MVARVLKRRASDQYPVRHIADFEQQLAGRKIFSTIDLVKANHQIPVHPDDIAKIAIITSGSPMWFLLWLWSRRVAVDIDVCPGNVHWFQSKRGTILQNVL